MLDAQEKSLPNQRFSRLYLLAEWTGLEPATPGVTGRYSNQLNYHSAVVQLLRETFQLPAKCHKLGDPTGIRTPVLTVKG